MNYSRDQVELMMRRSNLDPAPGNWPEVAAAMSADRLPGGMGWIIYGGTGSGKTSRARLAARLCGIEICEAAQLADEFRERGVVAAARLPGGWQMPSCRCGLSDLVIDDLGAEPLRVSVYGEMREPLREIIEARLNRWPRLRTYLTTNLTPEALERRYGERVASRIAGCCLAVCLDHPDWRRMPQEGAR